MRMHLYLLFIICFYKYNISVLVWLSVILSLYLHVIRYVHIVPNIFIKIMIIWHLIKECPTFHGKLIHVRIILKLSTFFCRAVECHHMGAQYHCILLCWTTLNHHDGNSFTVTYLSCCTCFNFFQILFTLQL